MKLLLFLTFLALACLARSAPPSSSEDRTLILPNYDVEQEAATDDKQDVEEDEEDEEVSTITTTTTGRSTYVFPTRSRTTMAPRRPWLTQRSSTVTTPENAPDFEGIDTNDFEHGFKYFKNIGDFFKKLIEDVKKFFKKIAGSDIIQAIRRFFRGQINE